MKLVNSEEIQSYLQRESVPATEKEQNGELLGICLAAIIKEPRIYDESERKEWGGQVHFH